MVTDVIPVLDTARFEHMQRVAVVMAASNLIPDGLCMTRGEDGKLQLLPEAQIKANCFLVVNQAVRWGMDPFAVAQCVSVVHGKLCYEGKLIAAVIEAKLGINLEYAITGQGEAMKVVVSGAIDGEPVVDSKKQPKTVKGTVADWKTDGKGSPWAARRISRMLRYRGAREWSRVHTPGLMLGVYSDDEMEALSSEDRRAMRARDVTPRDVKAADDDPPPPSEVGTGESKPAAAATEGTYLDLVESGRGRRPRRGGLGGHRRRRAAALQGRRRRGHPHRPDPQSRDAQEGPAQGDRSPGRHGGLLRLCRGPSRPA